MVRKIILLLICIFTNIGILIAQTPIVSGTVASAEDGGAIIGAMILVVGTFLGTVTDIDGKFSIDNLPSSAKTLRVSFVGMQSRTVSIQPGILKVILKPDTEMLDEVVVTAMGISRAKKALGHAVSEVNGDEIQKSRGGMTNPVNAFQGKVAGLQISSSSGSMGGYSKVLIRGVNSISGNNQPLFVIDGVPVEGGDFNSAKTSTGSDSYDYGNLIQDITPDDVENISILKGASASALYGSLASNGVVMITTKKGKKDDGLGVSFTSSVGFEMVNKLPKLQKIYGGGARGFIPVTINGTTYDYPDYAEDMSWGPRMEGQEILSWYDLARWEAGGKTGNPTTSKWQTPVHDIEDFFETGVSFTNNLSISPATERASLRLSYTNTNLNGYMPNSSMSKNAFSIAGTIASPDKKLETFVNANYMNTGVKGHLETGLGANIMKRRHEYISGESVGGLAIPLFYNLSNSISQAASYNDLRKKGIHSVFTNVSVDWENMLYLKATLRNDKSSTLPQGNNSYMYPSVTASFVFSELLKNKVPWVSFGKLRAGWAKVGNDTDPYQVLSVYSQYTNVDSSTSEHCLPDILNNEELKPESTTSYEIGLEMSFFNNRLGFDATYYSTETKDQIIPLSVSGTSGYLYKVINAGVIANKGVEFAISRVKYPTNESTLNGANWKEAVSRLTDGMNNYYSKMYWDVRTSTYDHSKNK